MSRTKGLCIKRRHFWTVDNSHDMLLARIADAAELSGAVSDEVVRDWRTLASVGDIALDYPKPGAPDVDLFKSLLALARVATISHGDVSQEYLSTWSGVDDLLVSGGHLRSEIDPATGRKPPWPASAVVDLADAIFEILDGSFPDDPPGHSWLVGVPEGREPIRMRGIPPDGTFERCSGTPH